MIDLDGLADVPWDLIGLATVLLINRVALGVLYRRPVVYWSVQALDLAVAVFVVWMGLPGLAGWAPAAWLVVAVMVFHMVQNAAMRSRQRQAAGEAERVREHMRISREAEREG